MLKPWVRKKLETVRKISNFIGVFLGGGAGVEGRGKRGSIDSIPKYTFTNRRTHIKYK